MKLKFFDKCGDREDICLYIITGCFGAMAGILMLLNEFFNFSILHRLPPCIFRAVTGLYCPACGGTRAFYSLINKDIIASISYNPIVLYAVICIIPFMIGKTMYYISKKRLCKNIHFMPGSVYLGLIILAINFIIKNAIILLG